MADLGRLGQRFTYTTAQFLMNIEVSCKKLAVPNLPVLDEGLAWIAVGTQNWPGGLRGVGVGGGVAELELEIGIE